MSDVRVALPPAYEWVGDESNQNILGDQYTINAYRVSAVPPCWRITLLLSETPDKSSRRIGWFQLERDGTRDQVMKLVESAALAAGSITKGLVS